MSFFFSSLGFCFSAIVIYLGGLQPSRGHVGTLIVNAATNTWAIICHQIHKEYSVKYTRNTQSNAQGILSQMHKKYSVKYTRNTQKGKSENKNAANWYI